MDNSFATGYALGADNAENRGNYGGWGMDGGCGWIWILLIFALWGWGGMGFGGGLGGANSPGLQGIATRADINEEFALNGIERGIQGIQQGICDSTYALTNNMNNGFSQAELARCNQQAAIMQQLNNMAFQYQQCCCDTQRAIERGFCDVGYNMAANTSNIIQSGHNDTDRVIAKLDAMENTRQQERIAALQSENQTLRFQASQAAQNAFITANQDAQTAELIRRISPMPVPSYQVPAPYPYCNRGCGTACC